MDEPIHRREDDQDLEIGGGRVRAMVQAVERRAQRERGGETRGREGGLVETMKSLVRTIARRAEHKLIPLEMQWMKEKMRNNLKKENRERCAVEPFPRDSRDAIVFESVDILEQKIDEWLIQYGRKNVQAALEKAKCDLKKDETNRYLREICRELYCRMDAIVSQKSRKVEEQDEEEEDELEDDLELLSLNEDGDDFEVDEDSLLSSFELVDALVDCTHQCSPSHAHHHSRIEKLLHQSPMGNSSAEVLPDHNPQLSIEEVNGPFDLLPQQELGLSGVPFRLDCKTQAYWMAVTEQWAAERVGMK